MGFTRSRVSRERVEPSRIRPIPRGPIGRPRREARRGAARQHPAGEVGEGGARALGPAVVLAPRGRGHVDVVVAAQRGGPAQRLRFGASPATRCSGSRPCCPRCRPPGSGTRAASRSRRIACPRASRCGRPPRRRWPRRRCGWGSTARRSPPAARTGPARTGRGRSPRSSPRCTARRARCAPSAGRPSRRGRRSCASGTAGPGARRKREEVVVGERRGDARCSPVTGSSCPRAARPPRCRGSRGGS